MIYLIFGCKFFFIYKKKEGNLVTEKIKKKRSKKQEARDVWQGAEKAKEKGS